MKTRWPSQAGVEEASESTRVGGLRRLQIDHPALREKHCQHSNCAVDPDRDIGNEAGRCDSAETRPVRALFI